MQTLTCISVIILSFIFLWWFDTCDPKYLSRNSMPETTKWEPSKLDLPIFVSLWGCSFKFSHLDISCQNSNFILLCLFHFSFDKPQQTFVHVGLPCDGSQLCWSLYWSLQTVYLNILYGLHVSVSSILFQLKRHEIMSKEMIPWYHGLILVQLFVSRN